MSEYGSVVVSWRLDNSWWSKHWSAERYPRLGQRYALSILASFWRQHYTVMTTCREPSQGIRVSAGEAIVLDTESGSLRLTSLTCMSTPAVTELPEET